MEENIEPYVDRVVARMNLPENQKYIFLIDCYPVHTGEAFRRELKLEFDRCILIFVPANCMSIQLRFTSVSSELISLGTSVFQAADMLQNRIVKHRIKQSMMAWMVQQHTEALRKGTSAEDFKIATSLPVLRDAQVASVVDAYKFMISDVGRELIKKVCASHYICTSSL